MASVSVLFVTGVQFPQDVHGVVKEVQPIAKRGDSQLTALPKATKQK
jgi:hypothetical protein